MSIFSRLASMLLSVLMGILSVFGVTLPVYYGDHMSLQGGMTKINDVKCFSVEHLSMINSLEK